MSPIRIAALTAAAGAVLLSLAAGASGRALDATWTGTWSSTRVSEWVFVQSGSTITGSAKASNYLFKGTVNGATLSGIEYSDPAAATLQGQCEYLKLTLAADGKSFSGFMSGSVTGPAKTIPSCPPVASGIPYEGRCIAGACMANTGAVAKSGVLGTWSYKGGAVTVTAAGAKAFKGVVSAATTGACKLAVGRKVWTIAQSGTKYTGTAVGCSGSRSSATFTATAGGLKLCAAGACAVLRRR